MPPSPLCGPSLDPPSDSVGHLGPGRQANAAPWSCQSRATSSLSERQEPSLPSRVYVSHGCRLVAKEVVSLATGKQGLPRQAGETGGALRQGEGVGRGGGRRREVAVRENPLGRPSLQGHRTQRWLGSPGDQFKGP